MKLLIILLLAMPAFADMLSWPLDTKGLPSKPGAQFQVYRDNEPYQATTIATTMAVPSCDPRIYTVAAVYPGQPAALSNPVVSSTCTATVPPPDIADSAALRSCKIEATKQYLANAACQGKLKAYGIK